MATHPYRNNRSMLSPNFPSCHNNNSVWRENSHFLFPEKKEILIWCSYLWDIRIEIPASWLWWQGQGRPPRAPPFVTWASWRSCNKERKKEKIITWRCQRQLFFSNDLPFERVHQWHWHLNIKGIFLRIFDPPASDHMLLTYQPPDIWGHHTISKSFCKYFPSPMTNEHFILEILIFPGVRS